MSTDFLASRRRQNFLLNLSNDLYKIHKNPLSRMGKVLGFKLSHANADLALLLLNKHPDIKADQGSFGMVEHIDRLVQDGERFKALYKLFEKGELFDAQRTEILRYFFADEMVPTIKAAIKAFPGMTYQDDYYRRSFRSQGFKQIYFVRQINFLLELLQEERFQLSVSEKIIHANNTGARALSYYIGAAIDGGDQAVRDLCLDIIYGRHDNGKPSHPVIKGMLISNDPECWKAVGDLLLSAQRQEGLRQSILECLDETSVGALKYFIKLILEHKLGRFSSVARAIDVWAGFGWESAREKTVQRFLELADRYLNAPELISQAIKSQDNAEVYMALWAQGVFEVIDCNPLIAEVLKGNAEKRSLALYFANQVGVSSTAIKFGAAFIDDEDPVVVQQACLMMNHPAFIDRISRKEALEYFEKLKLVSERMPPKKKKFPARVFEWMEFTVDRTEVYRLMVNLLDFKKEEDLKRMLPLFPALDVDNRSRMARAVLPGFGQYESRKDKVSSLKSWQVDFAFDTISDRSSDIRYRATEALKIAKLSREQIENLESFLNRKSADFRKSVLELIQKAGKEQMRISAKRLLACSTEEQRLAGLDLLLKLQEFDSEAANIEKYLEEFLASHKPSSRESLVLEGFSFINKDKEEYSEKNGFGLYEPKEVPNKAFLLSTAYNGMLKKLSKTTMPGLSMSPAKIDEALKNLGKLFLAHSKEEISYKDYNDQVQTALLGNAYDAFNINTRDVSPEEAYKRLPLYEVWDNWYLNSGLKPNDLMIINMYSHGSDGIIKGKYAISSFEETDRLIYIPNFPSVSQYDFQNPLHRIIRALSHKYPLEEAIDFLTDYTRLLYNAIPKSKVSGYKKSEHYYTNITTWRNDSSLNQSFSALRGLRYKMDAKQFASYWEIAIWSYLSSSKFEDVHESYKPDLADFLRAYEEKLIGKDFLMWRILSQDALRQLTGKLYGNQRDLNKDFPFVKEFLDPARERILEIELIRGDSSTTVTHLAQNLDRIYGLQNFISILGGLGKETLNRGYIYRWGNQEYTKKEVLSTLLKNCYPEEGLDQTEFNQKIEAAKITEKRLVEAAVYAPQWLKLISKYLNWNEMESGVWWLHAHAKLEYERNNEGEIAKYSAVEIADFNIGAVDIEWFKHTYQSLGKANWEKLYAAAKYISGGNAHSRARLYADVMLGNTKITEVVNKIKETRNQDYLRVYGLVPLNRKNPEADTLRRYKFIQEFKKESKQHGAQRQASEAIALKVAFDNLARTAGYPDPLRLEWAMESKETREVLAAAQDLEIGDLRVSLEIDEQGKSAVNAYRDGKLLKAIPAKERKNKEILKLREHSKELREQYRRTRKSLEQAMVKGDSFSMEEVAKLMEHPILKPMLSKLVLCADNKLGFWQDGALRDLEDNVIEDTDSVRIAHCFDLHQSGQWSDYQHYCFENEVVQPFKQIFRELYIPTDDELKEGNFSRRYAGHQIQTRKALALLKSRGWTTDEGNGMQKVMHQERMVASLYASADWFSPSDVEAPKIEGLDFRKLKDGERIDLKEIDGRLFSETLRDMDLVVSVAHVGEVDPEASQSSIELRAVIVTETAKLFKLKNLNVKGNHVLIKGDLAEYSVHLGSANCHIIAGPEMNIIAVPSQHRGRMFLPFVDEDPKTAELLSKVLLLARDKKIKDPSILKHIPA